MAFTRDLACAKAMVPHDEHFRSDLLCQFAQDFGVTHIFTPAPRAEWSRIYDGLDFARTSLFQVLTGYLDESVVRRVARLSRGIRERSVDIGYRSWSVSPALGRHGMLKREVGDVFRERALKRGLRTDISMQRQDAFFGDDWLRFLLRCRYTLGVEGGASVFDREGRIAKCASEYLAGNPEASFELVESVCFPEEDGEFAYRLIGPRHLEAAATRTCQLLVEGDYNSVLVPGRHYIPIRRDFSNVEEVLQRLSDEESRRAVVERAYSELVASKRYTYRDFALLVAAACLGDVRPASRSAKLRFWSPRLALNRVDELTWPLRSEVGRRRLDSRIRVAARSSTRKIACAVVGNERFSALMSTLRSAISRRS